MNRLLTKLLALAAACLLLAGCEPPTADSHQTGYRGTGMVVYTQPGREAELRALNEAPEATPQLPATAPYARDIYQNVQVLGDLSVGQFNRLMAAMTQWVSPEQGCSYCHVDGDLASDDVYTKVVSRRMLQMTQHVNENWTAHVGETGVTCYTCHRGNNVPEYLWWEHPGPFGGEYFMGNRAGGNVPGVEANANSTLPYDPYSPFLLGDADIRVESTEALPSDHSSTMRESENTYALMIHMSDSLGVNCTFCHNSQAFNDWEQSTPQRVTAWHGIRMARDLNTDFLDPLQSVYPESRLGPTGDAPKANCLTCHQGVNRPLNGARMAQDYPSLQRSSG